MLLHYWSIYPFGHLHIRTKNLTEFTTSTAHFRIVIHTFNIKTVTMLWSVNVSMIGELSNIMIWYDMIDLNKSLSFLSTTALVYRLKDTEQLVHHEVEQNAGSNARWKPSGLESINSTTGASLCVENQCDFIGFFLNWMPCGSLEFFLLAHRRFEALSHLCIICLNSVNNLIDELISKSLSCHLTSLSIHTITMSDVTFSH